MPTYVPTQITNVRDSSLTAQSGGVATAPTAGTAITTCTITTPGLYEVTVWVGNGAGTAVAADVGNMKLLQGTTVKIGNLVTPLAGVTQTPFTVILNCAALDTIVVQAVGNATSGVVYAATVIARLLAAA